MINPRLITSGLSFDSSNSRRSAHQRGRAFALASSHRPSLRAAGAALSALIAASLVAGCGFGFRKPERAQWRKDAEAACFRSKAVKESSYIRRLGGLDGPGACGADLPLKVAGVASESSRVMAYAQDLARGQDVTTASYPGSRPQSQGFLGLNLFGSSRAQPRDMIAQIMPEATLNCPMTAALDGWIAGVIQPAALARFGAPVIEVRTMGSYSCRPRNSQRGAATSEHGYANALDVAGFKLADGRSVSVLKGWRGDSAEQAFLRDAHAGACKYFSTVLGPGADMFHHDHFHVDLARHGRNGERSVCRPAAQSGDLIAARQSQTYAQNTPSARGLNYNQPQRQPAPQQPSDDDTEMDVRELDLPEEPAAPAPAPQARKWFWQ